MPRSYPAGFSLFELVLYIALTAVLLTVTSALLGVLLQARIKQRSIAEIDQQGLQIIQLLLTSVESADSILEPLPGASATSLSLVPADGASSPVVFQEASGVFTMSVAGGDGISLHNSRVILSNLNIENLGESGITDSLHFSFTLSHENEGGRNEYDYARTFYGAVSLR